MPEAPVASEDQEEDGSHPSSVLSRLPATYTPLDYLPDRKEISAELLEYLRDASSKTTSGHLSSSSSGGSDAFLSSLSLLFKEQVSTTEGQHAAPVVASYTSTRKGEVEFPFAFLADGSRASQEYKDAVGGFWDSARDAAVEGIEGPNFYTLVKRNTSMSLPASAAGAREAESARVPRRHRLTCGFQLALTAGANDAYNSARKQAAGDAAAYIPRRRLKVSFLPIILVPSAPSSPVQLTNVKLFLEVGRYVDPTRYYIRDTDGSPILQTVKPDREVVSCRQYVPSLDEYTVKFRNFLVIDNPKLLSSKRGGAADNQLRWENVCCCISGGRDWELEPYYPPPSFYSDTSASSGGGGSGAAKRGRIDASALTEASRRHTPSELFSLMKGFVAYFEDDPVPHGVNTWRVTPLLLTRRAVKDYQHSGQAAQFWEQLLTFMQEHPRFGTYTIPADEDMEQ